MNIKDMVLQYLDSDETEKFGCWAFGDEYKEISGFTQFLNAWNTRHGHKLYLKTYNMPADDIPEMINVWRKSLDKQS